MPSIKPWLSKIIVCLLALVMAGCTAMSRPRIEPGDPDFAPVPPRELEARDVVNGGIFQSSGRFNLYGDQVGLKVGDILTIVLEEETQSSKSAASSITKEQQIEIANGTVLGMEISPKNLSLLTNLMAQRDFSGDAEADQSNSLEGNITVSVVDVLPNGILRVRGEKWLSLTNGDEYIRISGLVRPADINPDNTVSSTRVADARIAYAGTGAFDQANRQGWLAQFFNSEWWPF
ncbi:flagellar basal body L-ring protein FlgH [Hydrocarboniclastica marina]|uniref:Flagellar L-ring protein n=1 Tax=Hydrocarboniclastica marina TaxID=2259620 RepID=A0A4P7XFV3_9ALTE|nr:flagellar basal body L-ring protein FlgH [Hydrocarboniclastica marina]MAL98377.1 flagellar basal body L-ring protein FlgH [Alteromonadaceae bacterium]QCF25859.1 flagellar basal body L-ring protein FlgH [Hydrocarboniclastica marina]|tara:strand:+ start:645 stop:1343 length:699 start_codon:yes stop_codon:yes gene_type:complete